MKKKVVAVIFICILFYAGYKAYVKQRNKEKANNSSQNSGQSGKSREKAVPVTAVKIDVKDIEQKLVVTGEQEPLNRAEISSKLTGTIKNISGAIGKFVSKNDVLVNLDDDEYREYLKSAELSYSIVKAAVEKQKIETENLKNQFIRTKELFNHKLTSMESLESAETKYKSASASLEYNNAQLDQEKNKIDQAKLKLSYTVISAPFDGFIESIKSEVGTIVSPGKTILTFVDISRIKIAVNIMEKYYNEIKTGQTVSISVSSINQNYNGKITNISPTVDPSSKTFRVEITVDNYGFKLRPGMSASVTISLKSFKNAYYTHSAAVYKLENKQGMYIINDDNIAEFVEIEIISVENGNVGFITKEKLNENSRAVELGGHLIKSGDKVSVDK
ncbi:efflux RND transporter periplasmic adaptor subunit [Candidatus Dependentiae bacterium]|nr:efflux RND transporter periplasmic adaptor subunit [Candidatus Dependentiae bacterium]